MPLISTAAHLDELARLANETAGERVDLILVADCGEWAQSKDIPLGIKNPRAMAVRRRPVGTPMVVLRAEYEASHLDDQASALFAVGWVDQSVEVRDSVSFLRFLVLHELAHLLNNWGQEQEQECNEWAFQRLGWSQ